MAPRFEIVPARRYMCGRIARQLRQEHHEATLRVGIDPHRGIRGVFDQSFYCRAWMIDGELAALGGALGNVMSTSTFVWMAMTDRATRYPKQIVTEARRQMDIVLNFGKRELTTTVLDGDETAKRFLVFLGWRVTPEGDGAAAESAHGRRRLMDFIRHEPDIRKPLGGGFAIRLEYEPAVEGV